MKNEKRINEKMNNKQTIKNKWQRLKKGSPEKPDELKSKKNKNIEFGNVSFICFIFVYRFLFIVFSFLSRFSFMFLESLDFARCSSLVSPFFA